MNDSSLFAAAGNIDGLEQVALAVLSAPLVLYALIAIAVWCWFFWRKVTVFSLFVLVALISIALLYVRVVLLPGFGPP